MNESPQKHANLAPLAVALLVIMTAWGNAMAIFIVSALLVIGLLVFAGNRVNKVAVAAVACLVAFTVAFLIQAQ